MLSELLLSHFFLNRYYLLDPCANWVVLQVSKYPFFLKLNIQQKWETTKWVYVQTQTSASYHQAQTPFIYHYSTLLVLLISQNFWSFWQLETIEEQCPPTTVCTGTLWRHHNRSAQALYGGTTTVLHRPSVEAPQLFCTGTLMQGPAEVYTDSLMDIFSREAWRNNYDVCL